MVTGLYAALATSASVFVGILTALLVSSISNNQDERGYIERRVQAINARLENLNEQYTALDERIDEVVEWNQNVEAHDQVDEFTSEYEDEFDEGDVSPDLVRRLFKAFLEEGSLSEQQEEVLMDRYEEIEDELTVDVA